MWLYVETFLLVFLTDVLYTYYLKSVAKNKPLMASFWATVVTFCASVAAINYVEDHTMLVASLLGAFCGTYVGMRKKND
jgi:hypothetical protein